MPRVLLLLLLLASVAPAGDEDPVAALTELVESRRSRTVDDLQAILDAVRKTQGRPLPGGTVSSILRIATAYVDLDDEPRRMAALRAPSLAVLGALFYPRWRGTAEAPGFRVEGLGFWPAPTRVHDFFQHLPSSRKTPDPVTARKPIGPFSDYVTTADPAKGVEVAARKVGAWLRIRIVNRGEKPLLVNPLAFRLGAARRITPRGGTPEIRLTLGAPSSNFRLEMLPAVEFFPAIDPGGAKTFTYPLPSALDEETKLFVEFTDGLVLRKEEDRKLPFPRLRSFRAVPVRMAEPPLSEPDRSARALVDELVARDSDRDLTDPVNRLLALGPAVVARALGDALDRSCDRDSPADRARPRIYALAHLVGGLPPLDTDRNTVVDRFPVRCGFVLGCEISSGRYYAEHHRRWGPPIGIEDLLGAAPRLVPPFVPKAGALLDDLLEGGRWIEGKWIGGGPLLARSVAVGSAARADPDLARRLLAGFAAGKFTKDGEDPEAGRTCHLAIALGALGTDPARAAVRKRVESLAVLPETPRLWSGLRAVARSMVLSGDDAGITSARARLARSGRSSKHLEWFESGLGPDRALAPLLSRAGPRTGALAVMLLAAKLRKFDPAELSPETRLRLLDLAVRHSSEGLARQLLWAGSGSTFQSTDRFRHVSPGDVEKGMTRREFGREAGGWPDPLRAAVKLRSAIKDGSVRVERAAGESESVYPLPPTPTPVPEFRARRQGDRILIDLVNAGSAPIALNPFAFHFAVAEVVDVTETAGNETREFRLLRIHLGRIVDGFRVSAESLVVLKPGAFATFFVPFPAGSGERARLEVALDDRFGVDGELPAALVRTVPEVEVRPR